LFSFWPLLAWVYESGFANFYQGLSPKQKPQNPAFKGAFCQFPPVLGQNEWRTLAQGSQAGFPHPAADRRAQISGQILPVKPTPHQSRNFPFAKELQEIAALA
jgi:hypothetical protein